MSWILLVLAIRFSPSPFPRLFICLLHLCSAQEDCRSQNIAALNSTDGWNSLKLQITATKSKGHALKSYHGFVLLTITCPVKPLRTRGEWICTHWLVPQLRFAPLNARSSLSIWPRSFLQLQISAAGFAVHLLPACSFSRCNQWQFYPPPPTFQGSKFQGIWTMLGES